MQQVLQEWLKHVSKCPSRLSWLKLDFLAFGRRPEELAMKYADSKSSLSSCSSRVEF
jgi:hypothetical protein